MSEPDTLLAFCCLFRSRSLWRCGPDWESQLPQAMAYAERVRQVIGASASLLLTDSPRLRALARDHTRSFSIHLTRKRYWPDALPALMRGRIPPYCLVVNPFHALCQPDITSRLLESCVRTRQIGLTVRNPDPHPLYFLAERGPSGKSTSTHMLCIHTSHWYNYSLYFTFRGRAFPFRRQNYPPVLETCNAALAFPSSHLRSVENEISRGRFKPFVLSAPACYDLSSDRERMAASIFLDERRQSGRP